MKAKLLLLSLIFFVSAGCTAPTSSQEPTPVEARGTAPLPAGEASTRIGQLAPHLPESTLAVIDLDVSKIKSSEALQGLVSKIMKPQAFTAMIDEMNPVIQEELGVDLLSLSWLTVAFTEEMQVLVFAGGLSVSTENLLITEETDDRVLQGMGGVRLMELDAPDCTLFFVDRGAEAAYKALKSGQKQSLEKSPRLARFESMMGGDQVAILAALLDVPMVAALMKDAPVKELEAATIRIGGEAALELRVRGSETSIQALSGFYSLFVAGVKGKLAEDMGELDQAPLERAVGMLIGEALVEGAIERLQPRFEGQEAVLQIDLPATGQSSMLLMTLAASGAAIAIPTFVAKRNSSTDTALVVKVIEDFAQISVEHKECGAMSEAMKAYRSANAAEIEAMAEMIKADEGFSPEEEKRVSEAMTLLMTQTGDCPDAMQQVLALLGL